MPPIETNAPVIEDDTIVDGDATVVEDGELDEEADTSAAEDGAAEAGDGDEGDGESAADDAEDGVSISIGDPAANEEDDPARAPEWVRELRKSNREKDRVIRERDAEIARLKGPNGQAAEVVVGDEPTFEGCDYDPEKFKVQLRQWNERKAKADQQQRDRESALAADRTKWQNRMTAVQAEAAKLKVPDYEETVDTLETLFSPVQIGIVLGGPNDPKVSAALRYALGKNHKKARELAAIQDPVKFAFAVAHLEKELKVTPRKSAPPPERMARSSVAGAGAVDNTLAKLQAEADKTGNRTKVAAYIRSKQGKQAA
jgi:hypothetical protein